MIRPELVPGVKMLSKTCSGARSVSGEGRGTGERRGGSAHLPAPRLAELEPEPSCVPRRERQEPIRGSTCVVADNRRLPNLDGPSPLLASNLDVDVGCEEDQTTTAALLRSLPRECPPPPPLGIPRRGRTGRPSETARAGATSRGVLDGMSRGRKADGLGARSTAGQEEMRGRNPYARVLLRVSAPASSSLTSCF